MSSIYYREVLDSIKSVGLKSALGHIWGTFRDFSFDLKYGTDTMLWEKLDDLDVDSVNRQRGIDYHPTRSKPFRQLLVALDLPHDSVFVDFGCGKGRGLLLALEYKFKRVVGIEFSQRLCDIARENVEKYKKRSKRQSPEAKRIRELERELNRKDKALAEVTALLALKKKLESLFGDEDDDTTGRNAR